ncbi:hypothetical protein SD71_07575 [Cohnella kolymensis]|uniref:Uncharacterized protein n=1 Tax=Cohnella kolymensis TaxID=1590652 RepID=A0ABR5A6R4_9BACL|nr:hypothetical protein [Cohnella kolymensis]KIL36458.1 hypothetical protein SD71_07575 [Cohnella kolymensis]
MSTAIKWIAIVAIGGAFGVWFGMSGIEILSVPGILILAGAIFILTFTIAIVHNLYVFRADKNMRAVEAHLNKAKHPTMPSCVK